jgi:hypothetical protein
MEAVKGSTIKITTTFYLDAAKTLIANLTGATVRFMIKRQVNDPDSTAIITKNVGSGITLTLPLLGICETLIVAADTNALSDSKVYFEIVAKLADGVTYIRSGSEELILKSNVAKVLI